MIHKRPEEFGFTAKQNFLVTHQHRVSTMCNRYKRAIIDDVTSQNIDETLRASLLDLFE